MNTKLLTLGILIALAGSGATLKGIANPEGWQVTVTDPGGPGTPPPVYLYPDVYALSFEKLSSTGNPNVLSGVKINEGFFTRTWRGDQTLANFAIGTADALNLTLVPNGWPITTPPTPPFDPPLPVLGAYMETWELSGANGLPLTEQAEFEDTNPSAPDL